MFLNPIDGVFHSVLLVAIEKFGLVANFRNRPVDCTRQDNSNASSILVATGQNTKARNPTRTKVKDMGGVGEDSSFLPVDWVVCYQAHQGWHDITVDLISNVFASVCIIYRYS